MYICTLYIGSGLLLCTAGAAVGLVCPCSLYVCTLALAEGCISEECPISYILSNLRARAKTAYTGIWSPQTPKFGVFWGPLVIKP